MLIDFNQRNKMEQNIKSHSYGPTLIVETKKYLYLYRSLNAQYRVAFININFIYYRTIWIPFLLLELRSKIYSSIRIAFD